MSVRHLRAPGSETPTERRHGGGRSGSFKLSHACAFPHEYSQAVELHKLTVPSTPPQSKMAVTKPVSVNMNPGEPTGGGSARLSRRRFITTQNTSSRPSGENDVLQKSVSEAAQRQMITFTAEHKINQVCNGPRWEHDKHPWRRAALRNTATQSSSVAAKQRK